MSTLAPLLMDTNALSPPSRAPSSSSPSGPASAEDSVSQLLCAAQAFQRVLSGFDPSSLLAVETIDPVSSALGEVRQTLAFVLAVLPEISARRTAAASPAMPSTGESLSRERALSGGREPVGAGGHQIVGPHAEYPISPTEYVYASSSSATLSPWPTAPRKRSLSPPSFPSPVLSLPLPLTLPTPTASSPAQKVAPPHPWGAPSSFPLPSYYTWTAGIWCCNHQRCIAANASSSPGKRRMFGMYRASRACPSSILKRAREHVVKHLEEGEGWKEGGVADVLLQAAAVSGKEEEGRGKRARTSSGASESSAP